MTQTIRHIADAIRSANSRKGGLARPIEKVKARIPADTFLWLGWGAVLASVGVWLSGRRSTASFIGLWGPTLLVFGLYSRLARQLGRDRYDR